jgi:hypothetical protein
LFGRTEASKSTRPGTCDLTGANRDLAHFVNQILLGFCESKLPEGTLLKDADSSWDYRTPAV